jgi:hypothetical protein
MPDDAMGKAEPEAIDPTDAPSPTPSQIAREAALRAAAAMRSHVQGKAKEIDPERSGQLAPSHTPGRGD